MVWYEELGKKLSGGYELGKKVLASGIALGNKVRHFANSDVVQGIYKMLPPRLQAPVSAVAMLGEKALTMAEKLQSKINTGEQYAERVKDAFNRAKSVEMPRQTNAVNKEQLMEQGSSLRIPDKMITGGSRSQEITTRGPIGPAMSPMMF